MNTIKDFNKVIGELNEAADSIGSSDKTTIIIQASHGGFFDGKYWTNPQDGKLYDHGEFIAYEGVTNRAIAARLQSKLSSANIPFIPIYHQYKDFPNLSDITKRVNGSLVNGKKYLYVAIHSNAAKGNGFEFFVSKNASPLSIRAAEELASQFRHDFTGEFPVRAEVPNRWYKVKDYYEIKNTYCPAVLCELLYFDEIKQARFLNSEEGQERIAESLFNAVSRITQ